MDEIIERKKTHHDEYAAVEDIADEEEGQDNAEPHARPHTQIVLSEKKKTRVHKQHNIIPQS